MVRRFASPGISERSEVMSDTANDRLEKARVILAAMSPEYRIDLKRGKVVFSCPSHNGGVWSRQWQSVSAGSFYPKWRSPNHGGTWEVCAAQLVRHITGRPHLPMGWWRQAVRVGISPEVLDAAKSVGWPESLPCVHCEKMLETGYDWWSLGKVEGVSCWGGVCRKKSGN